MSLNESYSRVGIDKHMSDTFLVKNVLNQRNALSLLFLNYALEYDEKGSSKTRMA